MIENKQSVSIFPRLAAGIYDALLMLGVWFTVGSLGLIIQYFFTGKIGSWPSWLGLSLVIFSTWSYFIFFWLYGGKTLGMSSWKIKVVNHDEKNLSVLQLSVKFMINILTFALCGIPLIFIFFHKDKMSFSDYLSQTRIIKNLDP